MKFCAKKIVYFSVDCVNDSTPRRLQVTCGCSLFTRLGFHLMYVQYCKCDFSLVCKIVSICGLLPPPPFFFSSSFTVDRQGFYLGLADLQAMI